MEVAHELCRLPLQPSLHWAVSLQRHFKTREGSWPLEVNVNLWMHVSHVHHRGFTTWGKTILIFGWKLCIHLWRHVSHSTLAMLSIHSYTHS